MNTFELVEKITNLRKQGLDKIGSEIYLKVYEMIKRFSEWDYEIWENLKLGNFSVQTILFDTDKSYWVKVKDKKFLYGESIIKNPSLSIITSKDIGVGMIFCEVKNYVIYENSIIKGKPIVFDIYRDIIDRACGIYHKYTLF